jgi:transposase
LGHAHRKALGVQARQQGRELAAVAGEAQAALLTGSSLKAALDLESGVVRAVGVTAANVPEAAVTADLQADLDRQQCVLAEVHLDRAYLASDWVRARPQERQIFCKAWPVRNGVRFAKTTFALDWERHTIRCPNEQEVAFQPGGTVRFPAAVCAACPLRERCTASSHGRSVHVHPDDRVLQELRQRQLTPAGRAKLRERVAVDHSLAHLGRWQGRRCRYRGQRKALFDTRRCAAIHNLHVALRYDAVTNH